MADRLRVFGHVNHLSHNFEMLKLAKRGKVKFSYLETNVRRWTKYSARPEPTTWLTPDEFEWVQSYKPGDYDIAILHCDQQCVDPSIGKGHPLRDLSKIITDIPVAIVNHGTPMWDEQRTEEMVINGGDVHTPKGIVHFDGMKELVKNATIMIVNSYAAVERWGDTHPNIYPLIHGLQFSEWEDFNLPKEPRVVLPLSPAGLDKYYNRSLCTAIKAAVKERTGLDVMHPNVNINFEQDNWTQYRDFIGRSLICIFPFRDSPMPRSRTEALLTGSVCLSSRHHNADEFIENGVNGFILPDNPLSYAEVIDILIQEGYREGIKIGQSGQKMAKKYFNIERYHDQLYEILYEVANGRIPKWNGEKVWDKK